MIGKEPSLELVAATEEVEAVNLRCDESLEGEAEQTIYNIDLNCSTCERPIRLVLSCSPAGVRSLAVLLRQREVQLFCDACTRAYA
uniref:Protein E7 n=1 Tax=Rousettus bat papillomavirus TaxID=3141903 RepID=A0AAU7E2K4_9PAPI